jgi:hypothetical protein
MNTIELELGEKILREHSSERTRCTVYTRVMGYHRPVETFNKGKQGEFEDRTHFIEPTHDNEPSNLHHPSEEKL